MQGRGYGCGMGAGGAGFDEDMGTGGRAAWRGTAADLGDLDLAEEARAEVLKHDAVGGREEGEDVAHEVLLALVELLPVRVVGGQVYLLR